MVTHKAVPLLLVLALLCGLAAAAQDPDVLVFYREGCHDCEHMDDILTELHAQYPSLIIRYIEESDKDAVLMWSLASQYGIFPTDFPVIFVGDEAISGVGRDKELRLRAAVADCATNGCVSPLSYVEGPRIPWKTYIIVGLAALMLLLVSLR